LQRSNRHTVSHVPRIGAVAVLFAPACEIQDAHGQPERSGHDDCSTLHAASSCSIAIAMSLPRISDDA